MRICFTSDIHGNGKLYDQLADLLRAETPDLVILGGDLMRDVDLDEPAAPQVASMVDELMERVAAWQAAVPRLTVACILGNHDLAPAQDALQTHHDAGRIVLLDHRRLWQREGVAFLGYPCAPPSPHWAKDFERLDLPKDPIPKFAGVAWDPVGQRLRPVDLAEHFGRRPTIAQDLEQAEPVANPWILVAHAPPYESNLDRLPNVSYPIGSRAVRHFIEERQPLVSLHGHVHEAPEISESFIDRVGETLCINPGQSHDRLQAVLFEAERPVETLRHTVFA
ncbi:MAG: metallophosphoesterase [Phycisphaerae bacterium]|nr:metallophosphoesterase [Phycisphaerae bacterium]